MALANYKILHLNSFEKRMIYAQLSQLEMTDGPYVLIITHLLENQIEALSSIDEYLQENDLSLFPYPLYIIGYAPEYRGKLNLIFDKKFLPKFFNIKTRPLNIKENIVMNKINLIKENLKSIQHNEYQPIINEFSRTHKIIAEIHSENHFYQKIIAQTNFEGEFDD